MDAVYIFYRSLRIVASDLGCELIPVHNYWAGYLEENNLNSKDLVLSDSRYPNERGHQVIAEAMMQWLEIIFVHHRLLPVILKLSISTNMQEFNQ
jgi:hypothetical protein